MWSKKVVQKGDFKKLKMSFQCDQCNYKFTQEGSLNRHKMSVHKGINYQCDYKFTQKGSHKRPKMSVHEGISLLYV